MKKLIIATSILFAFSSAFAQRPDVKPEKSVYESKTSDAKPASSIEAKPNNAVGSSTKPAPVVKPTKSSRPVGTSSTRASRSAVGGGALKEKTNTPSKGVNKEKGSMNTMSNSRASQSAVSGGALKEKSNSSSKGKEKGEMNDSRDAEYGKERKEVDPNNEVFKADAEYCKGWNDGFLKAFPEDQLDGRRIPNCESNGTCKGYKCGYEAGMKKAEIMMK